MDEVDNNSMPSGSRKEACVSLSNTSNNGCVSTPIPFCDDVAYSRSGSTSSVDTKQTTKHGFLRGWFVAQNNEKGCNEQEEMNDDRGVHIHIPRMQASLQGYSPSPHCKQSPLRTRNGLNLTESQTVGYSVDDYLRLQSECKQLKQTQEKLVERIKIADLELDRQIVNVQRVLESNNRLLRDVSVKLNTSHGTIEYLQTVVTAKDAEIDRLRKALATSHSSTEDESYASSSPTSEEFVSTPNQSETSLRTLMVVDEARLVKS